MCLDAIGWAAHEPAVLFEQPLVDRARTRDPGAGRNAPGRAGAAFDPVAARASGDGMTRYLAALPEALYALFGTGYLGYTAARQWGKVKGVDQ